MTGVFGEGAKCYGSHVFEHFGTPRTRDAFNRHATGRRPVSALAVGEITG
jgi:hypothetical protein